MGEEAFCIAQIICNRDEGKPVAKRKCRRLAASDFKGERVPPPDIRPLTSSAWG